MDQQRSTIAQCQPNEAPAPYEAPRFLVHDLAVITLGGSPGAGDSGAGVTSQAPFDGNSSGESMDDENLYDDDPLRQPWDS